MSDNPMITVKNIVKDFHLRRHRSNSIKHSVVNMFEKKDKGIDVHHALKGVSFDIKEGEFFGILGRNGSGKSTLLKILAQIYQPTSGSVSHRGKLVPFIELGVGFKPELTGRDNVYLNGAMLGFSTKEIDERYDEIVAFAEIEEFMNQKLKNYSSGMRVRLAFAVATHADADILLLDEVLAVGDAAFQRKCYDYFSSLKQQKKTIVFVTHSMGVAREYCDRAVLIEDGKIAHHGDIDQVADEYLKMFNKSSHNLDDKKGDRWGDGKLQVINNELEITDEKVKFLLDVKCEEEPMNDVRVGIRIKDSHGKYLIGANNVNVSSGKTLDFNAREVKRIIFESPNIFGNSTYSISVTVIKNGTDTPNDSWDNIKSFSNTKDKVYYPLLLPAWLKVVDSYKIDKGE